MKAIAITTILVLFVAAVSGLDKPLDIKVTKTATCEKKSQKGDKIEVHYRGTLESDGTFVHFVTHLSSTFFASLSIFPKGIGRRTSQLPNSVFSSP